jgi:signal transduction histidine kinase
MNVNTLLTGMLVGCLFAAAPDVVQAEDKPGTAPEAVAMVKKAAAFIKANGREKAFAEIQNPKGQFVDRDLYVTVYDASGTCLAHGFNPKMVGKNMIDLKDPDGKPFIKERSEVAKTKDQFWIDYKYINPTTKQIARKSMYTEKAGDLLVSCGVYK